MKYIKDHPDDFAAFIETSMDKYCTTMLKDGTWGGQMEMNALAHVYKFNAIVH